MEKLEELVFLFEVVFTIKKRHSISDAHALYTKRVFLAAKQSTYSKSIQNETILLSKFFPAVGVA